MVIMDISITKPRIRKFLEATGDENDLHSKKYAAQQAGLPDIVAPGMFTGPLVLYSVARSRPYILQMNYFRFRWRLPVHPGDSLTAKVFGPQDEFNIDRYVGSQKDLKCLDLDNKTLISVFNSSEKKVMEILCGSILPPKFSFPRGQDKKEFPRTITKERLNDFFYAMGQNFASLKIPDFLVSALVPPSLLMWSGGNGMHIVQENIIYSRAELSGSRDVSAMTYFSKKEGRYYCGNHVIFSGKVLQTGRIKAVTHEPIPEIENLINNAKFSDC